MIDRIISLIVIWCCLVILIEDRKQRIKYFVLVLIALGLAIIDELFFEKFFALNFVEKPLIWISESMLELTAWLFDFTAYNLWWLVPLELIAIIIFIKKLPVEKESSKGEIE